MIERGVVNTLRLGLVLVLALAAAVVANLVLLGVATGPRDPVGRLSPRAGLIELPASTATTPATSRRGTSTRPRSEGRPASGGDD
jgi:hypothetical protein